MTDPARPRLAELAASAASIEDYVRAVFTVGDIFPSYLADFDEFLTKTAYFMNTIIRHGPTVAAAEASSASRSETSVRPALH